MTYMIEVKELNLAVALRQLIELFQDALKQKNSKIKNFMKSKINHWITNFPNYIKAYFSLQKLSNNMFFKDVEID